MAESQGGLPRKRPKLDHPDIFEKVYKDSQLLEQLRVTINLFRDGSKSLVLHPVVIAGTNADSPSSFSQADCRVVKEPTNKRPPTIRIQKLFKTGMFLLSNFAENCRIPKYENHRQALRKLLEYLDPKSRDHAALLSVANSKVEDECVWAVALGQHLLSQLALGSHFIIDKFYGTSKLKFDNEDEKYLCPCPGKEKLEGEFGDTSFGVPDGWHGHVDILMQVPVMLKKPTDEDDSDEASSSVEVKSKDHFSPANRRQMLSQAIVFSYLQHKENPGLNPLVPSLGFSTINMKVHFFDCVHDVLLESAYVKLFVGLAGEYQEQAMEALVFLWLTLNYKEFCTGLTDRAKQYKTRFRESVPGGVQDYETRVQRPCASQKQTPVDPDWWANFLDLSKDDSDSTPTKESSFDYEFEDAF